jgi:hypothetical protein
VDISIRFHPVHAHADSPEPGPRTSPTHTYANLRSPGGTPHRSDDLMLGPARGWGSLHGSHPKPPPVAIHPPDRSRQDSPGVPGSAPTTEVTAGGGLAAYVFRIQRFTTQPMQLPGVALDFIGGVFIGAIVAPPIPTRTLLTSGRRHPSNAFDPDA